MNPPFLETLATYDGLVLIHAELGGNTEKNPDYLGNLEKAIDHMLGLDKPVLELPLLVDEAFPLLERYKGRVHRIPSADYAACSIELAKPQILYIAEQIGKRPEEIIIAAGGIAAKACVKSFLQFWCREVEAPFPTTTDATRYQPTPTYQKLGKGVIIGPLTNEG